MSVSTLTIYNVLAVLSFVGLIVAGTGYGRRRTFGWMLVGASSLGYVVALLIEGRVTWITPALWMVASLIVVVRRMTASDARDAAARAYRQQLDVGEDRVSVTIPRGALPHGELLHLLSAVAGQWMARPAHPAWEVGDLDDELAQLGIPWNPDEADEPQQDSVARHLAGKAALVVVPEHAGVVGFRDLSVGRGVVYAHTPEGRAWIAERRERERTARDAEPVPPTKFELAQTEPALPTITVSPDTYTATLAAAKAIGLTLRLPGQLQAVVADVAVHRGYTLVALSAAGARWIRQLQAMAAAPSTGDECSGSAQADA